jgi:hypothetical protein
MTTSRSIPSIRATRGKQPHCVKPNPWNKDKLG